MGSVRPASLRGPYAKTPAVRRRILEACIEAFGETGFYGATMKDVAQRARISHTGLLHHFSRKEDLLAAVLELRAERSAEVLAAEGGLDPAGHPVEALRGMVAVLADHVQHPGLVELHCVLSGEATSPQHPAHAFYARQNRQLRAFFASAFGALADQGRLRPPADVPVDPGALATMTIALINGLQAQWLFDRESVDIDVAVRRFLQVLVPGLEG